VLRGIFVTGTDTGVGKTVVCAALLHRLLRARAVRYWKPVQTGIDEDDDTATVRCLTGCGPREVFRAGVRLPRPLSPHLAARLNGTTIVLDDLLTLASCQPPSEYWIVEGAGGVLVPLNDEALMIDLARRLALPVLVVVRTSLGTINHTLLTIEALRARSLSLVGAVMVGEPNPDNREAIERFGRIHVIGELPWLAPLTPAALQEAAQALCLTALPDV
jgi:malonyl-CoA O-methyltransferase